MAFERARGVSDLPGPIGAVGNLVRHWWAVVLRGLVAVAFGLVAIARPGVGMGFVVGFFSAFAILSGALAVAAALRAGREHRSWGVMLVEGAIGIGAGVAALAWPNLTMYALTLLIGGWAVGIGITELAAAFAMRKELPNEWLLGLEGAASLAFGIFALFRPRVGAVSIVLVLGVYALIFGATLIGLGFRLGRLKAALPPRGEARV